MDCRDREMSPTVGEKRGNVLSPTIYMVLEVEEKREIYNARLRTTEI